MQYIKNPVKIEERSMQIITEELGERLQQHPRELHTLVKRVIHTTADFEYVELLEYSGDFVSQMKESLLRPATLVTDTTMILSGINKRVLRELGVECHCFINDPETLALAKAEGITRSMAAVRVAAKRVPDPVFVIGNAPTTIFQIAEWMERDLLRPSCIVGVPVGFVGAAEAKEMVQDLQVPYIITKGRKGGSTVAVAIVNALLYELCGNIAP